MPDAVFGWGGGGFSGSSPQHASRRRAGGHSPRSEMQERNFPQRESMMESVAHELKCGNFEIMWRMKIGVLHFDRGDGRKKTLDYGEKRVVWVDSVEEGKIRVLVHRDEGNAKGFLTTYDLSGDEPQSIRGTDVEDVWKTREEMQKPEGGRERRGWRSEIETVQAQGGQREIVLASHEIYIGRNNKTIVVDRIDGDERHPFQRIRLKKGERALSVREGRKDGEFLVDVLRPAESGIGAYIQTRKYWIGEHGVRRLE